VILILADLTPKCQTTLFAELMGSRKLLKFVFHTAIIKDNLATFSASNFPQISITVWNTEYINCKRCSKSLTDWFTPYQSKSLKFQYY